MWNRSCEAIVFRSDTTKGKHFRSALCAYDVRAQVAQNDIIVILWSENNVIVILSSFWYQNDDK